MEYISLLLGTILLRPYVFIFLLLYLLLASHQIGWKRTLVWTITGYGLAFASEFSSIHWSFPFGDYFYIETTRDRELWIAGVPFMDSLSFTFLSYTGYSCAWQLVAAVKGRNSSQGGSLSRISGSLAVLFLGATITTLMDVIIDPVALQGDRWFLGQIYGYRNPGIYFGIPISNFAGWFFVSATIIGINQMLGFLFPDNEPCGRGNRIPYLHLGGFVLFVFVVGFNLTIAIWLKAYLLFVMGLFFVFAFLALSWKIFEKGDFFKPQLLALEEST